MHSPKIQSVYLYPSLDTRNFLNRIKIKRMKNNLIYGCNIVNNKLLEFQTIIEKMALYY